MARRKALGGIGAGLTAAGLQGLKNPPKVGLGGGAPPPFVGPMEPTSPLDMSGPPSADLMSGGPTPPAGASASAMPPGFEEILRMLGLA